MINFQLTFEADELLFGDYKEMSLISKIMFRNFDHNLKEEELQRENKLMSYERAFKMLENDMYIAEIGQAVLELKFKVESGNHQKGISLLQKFSDIFGTMRLVPLKMTSQVSKYQKLRYFLSFERYELVT